MPGNKVPLYAIISKVDGGWYSYGILTDLDIAKSYLSTSKRMYPGGEYRLCELVEIPPVEKAP